MKELLPRGSVWLYGRAGRKVAHGYTPLLAEVPPDARVLDLGCGPGHVAARILALHPSASVVGADKDPRMLRLARRTYAENARLRFAPADAGGLPFENSSFDLVWASEAFHHFAKVPAALRECLRVLRRSGELWIVEARPDLDRGEFRDSFGIPALPGLYGATRLLLGRHGATPRRQAELAALCLAAGFASAETTHHGAWARIRARAPA